MPTVDWIKKIGALWSRILPILSQPRLVTNSILAWQARRASKATFIAVTGSSAKSTTTALLSHILGKHNEVCAQVFDNSLDDIANAIRSVGPTAKFAVVETGVNGSNQMTYFAKVLQPDIAIATLIGLEHYSAFRKKEAVAREKGFLVAGIRPGGFAVLNADDENVMEMSARTCERIVTFGRERVADFQCLAVSSRYPEPLSVEIAWRGGKEKIVSQFIGEHFWLSIVAAFAVAVELGVEVETIKEMCASFEPTLNRCQLLPTEEGPVFILDAAKAPWETLPLAIHIIDEAAAPRRRIVIGQISDYAGRAKQIYRDAYRMARAASEEVIFVGEHAHRSMANEEDRKSGRFIESKTAREVYDHINNTAIKNELILLKSSQNLHLERVALAWKYDVKCWVNKCGKYIGCEQCGFFEYPFDQHDAILRERKSKLHGKG
jgi:UDP-N-acetylmuramoyl-tripeptide--D-alanyl-D-alanine ligase